MARINLLEGTYVARGIIASAQRCVNLYPEHNPQDAAAPVTHYVTPGLTFKKAPLTVGAARGLYTATNGSLYYVCGNTAYFVDVNFNVTALGLLLAPLSTPVEIQDNGNVLVIVDGTTSGYAVNLQTGIAGSVQGFTVKNNGTGGTNGNYTVPLVGGSGTGAIATVLVAAGTVNEISISGGANYLVGDNCTLGSAIPGLSGFTLTISAVGALPNAFAAINDPNFLGGTGVGYVDTFLLFSQPNSRNFYSSLSNVTFSQLTSGTAGQPQLGTILAGGTGGTGGTYTNQPLTGGSGSGATATVVVSGGVVTSVSLDPTGKGYNAGDVLSTSITGLVGFQFGLAQVNNPAFDPLFIAAKTGYPDLLSTLVTVHREIWLMGAFESTEVWYDAGGTQFPFQIMPGIFMQHGCIAPFSVATHDLDVFWLGVDNAGQGTVFKGTGYRAQRISTWAIANTISGFLQNGLTISDAIGFVYKQQDHIFYVLTFPSANATLVFDVGENLWHERTWTDPDSGNQNRVRFNCAAQAYGLNVVADWENGNIYLLDLNAFTDNGDPIVRVRGFPHILNDGKRMSYDRFALDMECGTTSVVVVAPAILIDEAGPELTDEAGPILTSGPEPTELAPQLRLQVSNDRGRTFYDAPMQSMGAQGEYLVQMQWRQLGIARDRVFQVTWSEPLFTGISGAWLDATPAET